MDLNINALGIGARISHPTFGEGIVIGIHTSTMDVFFKSEGDKELSRSFEGLEILESPREYDDSFQLDSLESTMRKLLSEFESIQHPVDLGSSAPINSQVDRGSFRLLSVEMLCPHSAAERSLAVEWTCRGLSPHPPA